MKKKLFALIIFAFAAFPVLATEWQQFSEKEYIDISSIKPYNDPDTFGKRKYNRDEKEYWVKLLNDKSSYFNDLEKKYHKKIWYVLSKQIIDCNNKTIATKAGAYYDTNNVQFSSFDIDHSLIERIDIIPDTQADFLYNYVCGYYHNSADVIGIKDMIISGDENSNLDDVINIVVESLDYIYEKVGKNLKLFIGENWKKSLKCNIKFTISKDGKLMDVKVVKSSKNKEFDNTAVNAIKTSAPFRPLPNEYNGQIINIETSFIYTKNK